MGFQFQFAPVFARSDVLLEGALLTLQLSGIGILFGALLGILLAMLRGLSPPALRWPVDAYVELVRNTPFLVQLLIIFFGLPSIGVRLTAEQAALSAIIAEPRRLFHRDRPRRASRACTAARSRPGCRWP